MKPGRELDALVAEKVMGWERRREFSKLDGMELMPLWWDGDRCRGETGPDYAWSPSTDLADAWEVVEKMEGADRWLFLSRHSFGWRAVFSSTSNSAPLHAEGRADTAPHAICLAALRAVGVEVDDG